MQPHVDSLKLYDIFKAYDQGDKSLQVLNGISVTFSKGKSYAITGSSGSGKSTLMHIIGLLDEPSSGQVYYNDVSTALMRGQEKKLFLNRTIGFVFQFHYLLNELTALENIMLMGLIKGESKQLVMERAQSLLNMVGLASKADSYPFQLSGGEQQRVAIARALFNRPAFLIADEPTGNLDAHNAQLMIDIFVQAQREWGMGLIICSHDKEIYQRMETVYRLANGVLHEVG